METHQLAKLAKLIRYFILISTTQAGSGHPTTSLSAVELMTVLFFKYLRFDLDQPENPANDRVIFSKGHAAPLLYALYAAAGKLTEADLLKMRTFGSTLEGHPSIRFPYTEAATGSLGQGLSIGVGMALALKAQCKMLDVKCKNLPKIYVLLGDGEMAEGAVWEAIQTASYYQLSNLIAIVDVNRLGQSGQTMLGSDINKYADRVASFGWQAITIEDGHDFEKISRAFEIVVNSSEKPIMLVVAKTIKGKGVSFLEDKEGWHGKPLSKEELKIALTEIGNVDKKVRGDIKKPQLLAKNLKLKSKNYNLKLKTDQAVEFSEYIKGELVATRKAFGTALVRLGKMYSDVVVLDGDVQNSTYSNQFAVAFPDRFYQMYIAEQNMVGAAVGLSRLGFRPVVSTFAAFLTRAADQIRMAQYNNVNIIFNGSHAGVSIGEDGPSQMGLEDLSLFRSVLNSTVLYPADAIATEKLVELAYQQNGIVYIRTTRSRTPVIYDNDEEFRIGGSKVYKSQITHSTRLRRAQSSRSGQANHNDQKSKVTIIAAGVTVYEVLRAQEQLEKQGIAVSVIDCYSIKPIDVATLKKAARETQNIITVEDHYPVGGLGDAVLEALADESEVKIYKLAVNKIPRSGKPEELLDYEGISAKAIIQKATSILTNH